MKKDKIPDIIKNNKDFKKFLKKIDNYENFLENIGEESSDIKGKYFEYVSYFLFLLDPIYMYQTQNIWLYSDIPNKVKRLLKLPEKDLGIDLLWQDKDDNYWPIQCKYRKNIKKPINWTDLSTYFGSLYDTENIKGGIFITNQLELNKKLLNNNKVNKYYGESWDNLPENFFKNILNLLNKNKIEEIEKKSPRDFQKPIIKNVCRYFKNKEIDLPKVDWNNDEEENEEYNERNRCTINMICGSGKTLVSLWISEKMKCRKTIIAVPSLNLLSQIYREWVTNISDKNTKFLLVGSDIHKDNNDIIDLDREFYITTDKKEIKEWYNKHIEDNIVVITTYQSSDKISKTLKFNLGIFDEAHKTVGEKNTNFNRLLFDENVKINHRMFMTATPKVYRENKNKEVLCMSNKKIYGDLVYIYSAKNALDDDVLTPYQILNIYSSDKQVKSYISENKLVKNTKLQIEKDETRIIASAIMLLKAMKKYKFNHIVTYHTTIKKAKRFEEILEILREKIYDKEINICSIDGSYSMNKRIQCFNEFKNNKRAIMCTSKILQEGINIQIIDAIMFVDDKHSIIDIVQCVGRSLRKYPNKEIAYILIPTLLEKDIESQNNSFKNVFKIIQALCSTDSDLYEYFKCVYNKKKYKGTIKFKNANLLETEEISTDISLKKWIKNIEINIFKSMDPWEVKYKKLEEWIEENGRLPSGKSKNKDEKSFGLFCGRMRQNKRKNKLTEYQENKLDRLKFWYFQQEDNFKINYKKLKKWIKENNKLPSQMSKNKDEKSLGWFCRRMRQNKRKNKLTEYQENKLDRLKFWYFQKDNFKINYKKLKKWIKENNKLPSESSGNKEERSIGLFCGRMRHHKRKNKLTEYQTNKLNGLKYWYFEKEDIFEINYKKLKKFIKDNDKLPSKESGDKAERSLINWWGAIRKNQRKKNLTEYQISKLEELPFWHFNRVDIFNINYKKLKKFIKDNDKLPNKRSKNISEKKLGNFCSDLRKNKQKNKLTEYQTNKLELLPRWKWKFK